MTAIEDNPAIKQKPETTSNSDGLNSNENFGESFNSKNSQFPLATQTKHPFVFSKFKTVCPCGEHNSFNALTSHISGGKCWSCDKFFKPNNDAVSPNYQRPTPSKPKTSKATQWRFVREHIYFTNDGKNYLTKVRIYKDENNKKHCPQYHWKGKLVWNDDGTFIPEGKWINGISGVTLTLYNAHKLIELQQSPLKGSTFVYIVEGEKDVDTLRKNGFIATCNPMGAGKWKDEYCNFLKDLICFIIPDNDEAGRNHAEQVCNSLQGIAKSVIILDLLELMQDLPVKGDLTDFYNLGGKLYE